MRPSLALSILLLSLLLILSSTTATAQTTQPQAVNSNSSGSTALRGQPGYALRHGYPGQRSCYLSGRRIPASLRPRID